VFETAHIVVRSDEQAETIFLKIKASKSAGFLGGTDARERTNRRRATSVRVLHDRLGAGVLLVVAFLALQLVLGSTYSTLQYGCLFATA
jgi:hypothetical protein